MGITYGEWRKFGTAWKSQNTVVIGVYIDTYMYIEGGARFPPCTIGICTRAIRVPPKSCQKKNSDASWTQASGRCEEWDSREGRLPVNVHKLLEVC